VAGELSDRFIRILQDSGALLTGDFTLKSGRKSSYFIDFGAVPDGEHLAALGACYAEKIAADLGIDSFDVIFGPAYKAIPIAAATAIALSTGHGASRRYAFNRKVAKDYGEARQLLGGRIEDGDRVLIVDDVLSDGLAKLETLELLRAHAQVAVTGILVGVDRSEPGTRERLIEKAGGVPIHSICTVAELETLFGSDRES
jgi:orotate phosphoribosyltransferase